MANGSSERFVLLISWQSGDVEKLEIPPSGIVELGPESEPVNATVPLYANGPNPVGKAVVRGGEIPSMNVAPSPSPRADSDTTPEWLAEIMSEQAKRHDLRSVAGLEKATFEVVTMGTEYTHRATACHALARGYQSSADALAAIDAGDEPGWARAHERAGEYFQKALSAARKAEAVAA